MVDGECSGNEGVRTCGWRRAPLRGQLTDVGTSKACVEGLVRYELDAFVPEAGRSGCSCRERSAARPTFRWAHGPTGGQRGWALGVDRSMIDKSASSRARCAWATLTLAHKTASGRLRPHQACGRADLSCPRLRGVEAAGPASADHLMGRMLPRRSTPPRHAKVALAHWPRADPSRGKPAERAFAKVNGRSTCSSREGPPTVPSQPGRSRTTRALKRRARGRAEPSVARWACEMEPWGVRR